MNLPKFSLQKNIPQSINLANLAKKKAQQTRGFVPEALYMASGKVRSNLFDDAGRDRGEASGRASSRSAR